MESLTQGVPGGAQQGPPISARTSSFVSPALTRPRPAPSPLSQPTATPVPPPSVNRDTLVGSPGQGMTSKSRVGIDGRPVPSSSPFLNPPSSPTGLSNPSGVTLPQNTPDEITRDPRDPRFFEQANAAMNNPNAPKPRGPQDWLQNLAAMLSLGLPAAAGRAGMMGSGRAGGARSVVDAIAEARSAAAADRAARAAQLGSISGKSVPGPSPATSRLRYDPHQMY